MKNRIKGFYRIIRNFPIIIIIMIMTMSAICTLVAANHITQTEKFIFARERIYSIEAKAEHGRIIDVKNGYMEHWNDELRSQYKEANEAFEKVLAYSSVAKWVNNNINTDMGIFVIIFTFLVAIAVMYNSVLAVYASFLALVKKACDYQEKKKRMLRNRHRTITLIRG